MRYVQPQADYELIVPRLRRLKEKGGILPDLSTVEDAWEGIESYALAKRAVIHGGFLILFDIGQEWYSTKMIFCEKLVMRVYDYGQADTIPGILTRLAEHHGCEVAMAGDALAGKMTPHYEQAGWRHLGTTLMKEINQCAEANSVS